MKARRIWIEIVLAGSAISLASALFLASIGAAAGIPEARDNAQQSQAAEPPKTELPGAQDSEQVFEGMVTCSRCGARHSPAMQQPATVCVRRCVRAGASFSLVSGESSYVLQGNPQTLKAFAGERARIVGALAGHVIQVRSVGPDS
jgi:hypothetical protein